MAKRVATPRVGSFITIAAALLMLFGAASRMGKETGTAPLFHIDQQAEKDIREENSRISNALGRYSAALTIGTPIPQNAQPQAVPINHNAMPPPRQEVDIDAIRRQAAGDGGRHPISAVAPDNRQDDAGLPQSLRPPQVSQPAVPQPAAPQLPRVESYTVENGDTWVKIAKRTLGDANRWRDIQNANPGSAGGLEVGMKLRIPK